ncbi:hypothetical protein BDA99DRAFT_494615 [Phascolomyces articulosus]|uniref:ASX DEUBAD domain-containing protein n=1 Tax=Phascolomyces articulosus TaxID=60185 RepID=A0AAD5KAR9_9FUNG|nr:hypothetical protein BDA99DRAFT_494615 [Phascolomyces articulosus]
MKTMTIYDPTTENVFMPPHVKSDSPGTQTEEDMALETSQLMIRSPDPTALDPSSQEHPMSMEQPYKKFRYDPWSVEYLCNDPTSPLANLPLESIFEFSAFQLLSSNEQDELARLLPTMDTNDNKTITEAFFSKDQNPIFWNALDDWQSMLANGDFNQQLQQQQQQQQHHHHSHSHHPNYPTTNDDNTITTAGLQQQQPLSTTEQHTNTIHDSFKDEAYETYWGELNDRDKMHNVAGDSKNITLKDMCRKGLIRERDVIVYKRNFSACKVVVSKSMTVVKANGSTGISIELDNEIFEDFETPTALETKILDQHGKVSKDKRPNGNAFKSIRLLRGGKDLGRLFDIRKDGFGEN